MKEIGELIVDGQEALGLSRRFEPLHDPLTPPCRLTGIFCTVVQAFVLAMLDVQRHVLLRGAIGWQFVRDHDARRFARLSQELAQEAPGGFSVAPTLNENVKNETVLVDGAPKPMLLACDGDNDLVQMPFVASLWGATTDVGGKLATKFLGPLAYGFVSDVNSAHGEHLFDHS